jgi:hypothetical protein
VSASKTTSMSVTTKQRKQEHQTEKRGLTTLKIGLIADFGAVKPGLGESPFRCPPYGDSFVGEGTTRREGLGCCRPSSALSPPLGNVPHDLAGDKLKVWIGGGEPRSESELESTDGCVRCWLWD